MNLSRAVCQIVKIMTNEHNSNLYCDHCGAKMLVQTHRLTPGIVHALRKFALAVFEKGKNEVHLTQDMTDPRFCLTKNEYNNFQKLRYFALVAKVRESDGVIKKGYWLLTRRGSLFLKNKTEVSISVKTYRNEVRHDLEGEVKKVSIAKYKNKIPEFQSDFGFEILDGNVFTYKPQQATLL